MDVTRNEVIATDENLFQILAFKRTDNTPENARTAPIRAIAGEQTQIEFQSGVYVDPESGDIYATNNDTRNKLAVFAHGGNGDIAPRRLLETPHGAFGITVDQAHSEMLITISTTAPSSQSWKRRTARVADSRSSGQQDRHRRSARHRDRSARRCVLRGELRVHARYERDDRETHRRAVRRAGCRQDELAARPECAIPGSGSITAPSIIIHKRTDSGNAPASRIIGSPATQLNWPTGLAFDAGAASSTWRTTPGPRSWSSTPAPAGTPRRNAC